MQQEENEMLMKFAYSTNWQQKNWKLTYGVLGKQLRQYDGKKLIFYWPEQNEFTRQIWVSSILFYVNRSLIKMQIHYLGRTKIYKI